MPKVSVVIPVFGVEKYIERCARSLFEQTLNDIEYIFIDDCSLDNSVENLFQIVNEYKSKLLEENKIVRIERMPRNSGQAAVRRYGIELATGDYIIHCDSDDWIEKSAYENLYNFAITENSDIVICDYYRTDGISKRYFRSVNKSNFSKDEYFRLLISAETSTALWNKLIRRDLYNNNIIHPIENMWEDYTWVVQLSYYANKISYLPEAFYNYFYNPNSICNSNHLVNTNKLLKNVNIILSFLDREIDIRLYRTELLKFKYYTRSELSLYVSDKKVVKIWRNIYPEINFLFLINRNINLREKIKFLSIYIGIYPLIVKKFLKSKQF